MPHEVGDVTAFAHRGGGRRVLRRDPVTAATAITTPALAAVVATAKAVAVLPTATDPAVTATNTATAIATAAVAAVVAGYQHGRGRDHRGGDPRHPAASSTATAAQNPPPLAKS